MECEEEGVDHGCYECECAVSEVVHDIDIKEDFDDTVSDCEEK
jgi:hypothetical protein